MSQTSDQEVVPATTPTPPPPAMQPLGYDVRGLDPWLAVVRFALLLGAVWGTLLLLEFATFILFNVYQSQSNLLVQFMLSPHMTVRSAGAVGCLFFGALLLVSAVECLKLRRRARKTFVVCVVGGFVSIVAGDVFSWWGVAQQWWASITGPSRMPMTGWLLSALIRPMHLAIIPAALMYLMTRKSVVARFD